MKRDDIRRLLRDADPARDRELPLSERARMRMSVTSTEARRSFDRSRVGTLALAGAAATVVVVAIVALAPRTEPLAEKHTVKAIIDVAPPPAAPIPAPAVAKHEIKTAPPRTHIRVARRIEPRRTTRIDFTAPEGTRILWFVETADAKELGS